MNFLSAPVTASRNCSLRHLLQAAPLKFATIINLKIVIKFQYNKIDFDAIIIQDFIRRFYNSIFINFTNSVF